MRKKILWVCIASFFLLVLNGCWSRKELNEMAFTVAMGFDKSDDHYMVSIQVVNPSGAASKKGGGNEAPIVTYSTEGTSVFEALRKTTTKSPRKLYLSHMRVIVISEEVAKEGIGKVLDFLSRDHDMRTDFFIVVTKDATAQEILKTLTLLEKVPANTMFASLESSSKAWAVTGEVTLDNLISDITNEGKEPVLTGIKLYGEKEIAGSKENVERIDKTAFLRYEGLAALKKDKLIGWLNEDESKGYNYIQNKVKSTVGYVSCPDGGSVTMEVIHTKSKVKGKAEKGKPKVEIQLQLEANVGEVQCSIDLTNEKTIRDLEMRSAEKIKDFMTQAIRKAQKKYKTDIFGFGNAIHRDNPKLWNKIKKDWDEEFVDMDVEVNVNFKIRGLGTISNSFLESIKE
ncbi:Ger(x)C family spore germination protein [Paenibacillus polymyxa]|uniref:Ger(x)C family spore germination protein n=1 Tax=Paenibacillus polymyxa TaxID=1406 RepID=UPI0025B686AF|nr:Ger(x)C family spore germination protein [Paenibacillus polymyxa]MDN4106424.1 Ger(x)C family spore germination protein [Paenibacillus polymyxa]